MKAPEWSENPEPALPTPDGSIILELDSVSDAYLWASKNSKEGWLAFEGETLDIEP